MNGTLTVIEPDKKLKTEEEKELRVCAYCRVSTAESDQRNSLAVQKAYFEREISKNEKWVNIGIFADEGISGTSLEKRDEFNRMIYEALNNNIDIILTKEVSRFSRNVKHLLNIVDELKAKGVYVWFLSDDIYTERNEDRERLAQIATNAEAESLRTSRRVKWGQAEKMKQGVIFGRKEMFGYNIVKDDFGKQCFEIIEEEAEVVKMIFELFADGCGTYKISQKLQEKGIKTKRYKNGWSNTVILRILRNEKYVGDLKQGKTYTPDPLDHKKKYNNGNVKMYEIKDHHPESAIISRELWDKVQRILEEKAPDEETKAKHSNRYWCSGKIYCGVCGNRFISHIKHQKTCDYKSWVCFEHNQRGIEKEKLIAGEKLKVGCNNKPINDKILKEAVHDILTEFIIPNQNEIKKNIIVEFEKNNKTPDNSKKINVKQKKLEKIKENLSNLCVKYNEGKIEDIPYKLGEKTYTEDIKKLEEEIRVLESEQKPTITAQKIKEDFLQKIDEIVNLSNDEINEDLYEKVVKKITVFPDKTIEIYFSFLNSPICMSYIASGRKEKYKVEFTIIPKKKIVQEVSQPENLMY